MGDFHVHARRGGKAEFAGLRLFCRDDNYPVGSPRTVDRRGGSILHDIDGLHLIIVHVDQLLKSDFKTVFDDQRGVQLSANSFVQVFHRHRESRVASDIDIRHTVRVATGHIVLHKIDGGVDVAKGLQQILPLVHFQLFCRDGGNGTGITLSRLVEDTGYDDLIQGFGILFQYDIQLFFPAVDALLGLHPDEGEFQADVIAFRNLEGVFSVGIRGSSDGGAAQYNRYPRKRGSACVGYFTGYLDAGNLLPGSIRLFCHRRDDDFFTLDFKGVFLTQPDFQGFAHFQLQLWQFHQLLYINLIVAVEETTFRLSPDFRE